MPISKENQKRYPPKKEWGIIRDRILGRAGYKCECTGQCGIEHDASGLEGEARHRCNAPQRAKIVRSADKKDWWFYVEPSQGKPTRIILTIAHYPDRTIENVSEGNLLALCQLCHLRIDRWQHAANAAETRRKKKGSTTSLGESDG